MCAGNPADERYGSIKICRPILTEELIYDKGKNMFLLSLIGFLVIREAFNYAMEDMNHESF